jgi:hypothetical protein
VKVYAVHDVDTSIAVMTLDADWHAVYVAEGTPQSSWPQVLKK